MFSTDMRFNFLFGRLLVLTCTIFMAAPSFSEEVPEGAYLHPSKNKDTRQEKADSNNPYSAEVAGEKHSRQCRVPPAFIEVHQSVKKEWSSGHNSYGFGKPIVEAAIEPWNIDVLGDGSGLPGPNVGMKIRDGEKLYLKYCSECHGEFGEGNGHYLPLTGGDLNLSDDGGPMPIKTVSNYWPYALTMFDYIRRAMPFFRPNHPDIGDAGYMGITGYILMLAEYTKESGLALDEDTFFNAQLLLEINEKTRNKDGFFCDPRPEAHNYRCGLDGKECPSQLVGDGKGDINNYTEARINPLTGKLQYNVSQFK